MQAKNLNQSGGCDKRRRWEAGTGGPLRGLMFTFRWKAGRDMGEGSNLHWQANSLPASNRGNPILYIVMCIHQSQFPKLSLPRNSLVTITYFLNEGKPSNPLSCLLLSHSSHARLFVTPWTVAHLAPLSMGFSGKNTGMGCHFLLQGIFPTQGSNWCLLCLLH